MPNDPGPGFWSCFAVPDLVKRFVKRLLSAWQATALDLPSLLVERMFIEKQ